MRLHLLGVNGPFPEPNAACSGYLLEAGSQLLQLDFGPGILARLTGLTAPEGLNAIFLSHWHFDHCSDLLPLIYRLEAMKKQVRLYAPVDETSAIRAIVAKAACFELRDVFPGDTVTLSDAEIRIGRAVHPVPAVMYRVAAEGKQFCYTGDTNAFEGLADFCTGADLLLADGLFPEEQWAPQKPHLSALRAAELARDTGAGQFILTHLNPTIPPAMLLKEARTAYPKTVLAIPGAKVTV